MTTRSGSRTTMRAASVRPGRLTRASGSALSSRTIDGAGACAAPPASRPAPARPGDVVAHAEAPQQTRRRALHPQEVPVGRRAAVGGCDGVVVPRAAAGVVAGDVLQAVARARHAEQGRRSRRRAEAQLLAPREVVDEPGEARRPLGGAPLQQEARGRRAAREGLPRRAPSWQQADAGSAGGSRDGPGRLRAPPGTSAQASRPRAVRRERSSTSTASIAAARDEVPALRQERPAATSERDHDRERGDQPRRGPRPGRAEREPGQGGEREREQRQCAHRLMRGDRAQRAERMREAAREPADQSDREDRERQRDARRAPAADEREHARAQA